MRARPSNSNGARNERQALSDRRDLDGLETRSDILRMVESQQRREPERPEVRCGFKDFPVLDAEPDAPPTGRARIYALDDGSGKVELMVRFPTGASQQVEIEP